MLGALSEEGLIRGVIQTGELIRGEIWYLDQDKSIQEA